jgi:hypothetical protein
MNGVLLMQAKARVDLGVLVVMGGHIEHLQPSQWVIAQGILPLSCQPLSQGHVRSQGGPAATAGATSSDGKGKGADQVDQAAKPGRHVGGRDPGLVHGPHVVVSAH